MLFKHGPTVTGVMGRGGYAALACVHPFISLRPTNEKLLRHSEGEGAGWSGRGEGNGVQVSYVLAPWCEKYLQLFKPRGSAISWAMVALDSMTPSRWPRWPHPDEHHTSMPLRAWGRWTYRRRARWGKLPVYSVPRLCPGASAWGGPGSAAGASTESKFGRAPCNRIVCGKFPRMW